MLRKISTSPSTLEKQQARDVAIKLGNMNALKLLVEDYNVSLLEYLPVTIYLHPKYTVKRLKQNLAYKLIPLRILLSVHVCFIILKWCLIFNQHIFRWLDNILASAIQPKQKNIKKLTNRKIKK